MESERSLPIDKSSEKKKSVKRKLRRPAIIGPLTVESKPAEEQKTTPEDRRLEELIKAGISKSAPEKSRLPDQQQRPEHIGRTVITAESKPAKAKPEVAERAPQATANTGGKRIETLSRAELMDLSEKILIDGSSLRQIYETHLIGERGLRRLVAEHLRDGDLHKALRHEIIEREIDFERDPVMRDMVPVQIPSAADAAPGKAALNQLLEGVDLANEDRGEEAAFFKARAIYEANQLNQHKQQRRLIDISLAAIISLLLLLVIVLYLMR